MAGVKSMGVEDFGGWIHSKAGLDVVRDSPPLPGQRMKADASRPALLQRLRGREYGISPLCRKRRPIYTPSVFW